ncbi:MAG TPA: phage tail protein [Pyrinomonadaceae bacterium]|jgi:phage tail-like protein
MSAFINNLEFFYSNLPEHFLAADEFLFLKRFMSPFCQELDEYDRVFSEFHRNINPDTATEEFLDYFLFSFFGWGWFPAWFTLERKRSFYRNVATHYARRGTARGLREFLAEFGVKARVINRPQFYEDVTLDQEEWTVDGPLYIFVQIFPRVEGVPENLSYFEDFTLDQDIAIDPQLQITRLDIDELLRFQQPLGQHIIVEDKLAA